ncbi:hypothetical protein Nepgr_001545 [Nepenthes gracilis]|uniref:HMA domain-containing protein n=1 Tax=Nepenthes gracilis TaxID=150966 RepID=A0AAD3RXK0_NEPGR|nr:hypothetical protein Nepgr_001545 [Nepenthes gracilis]
MVDNMIKQDFLKTQTCVLRVNIRCDCDGCKNKVKKLLQKIEGVYTVNIDAKQGKVTVAGNVDPATLIKKLLKSGKHAELWSTPQKIKNQFNLGYQFKDIQIDNGGKGSNEKNKSQNQKGGGKVQQKVGQQAAQQHYQQMKGFEDPKSVKFNLPQSVDYDDFSDDEFEDDEDEDDGFDDDDDDDDDCDDVFGHDHQKQSKNIPLTGNNGHGAKGQAGNQKKGGGSGGGGDGKKGGVFRLPSLMKGIGGNKAGKSDNGRKKGGGGGEDNKGGKQNQAGGAAKNGGKGGGDGKKGNISGGGGGNNKGGGANNGGNGKNNGDVGKKGGGKNEGFHEATATNLGGKGGGGGGGNPGQMGSYPMGQMGQNFQAAHVLPSAALMNGGGYYQGMGPALNNPYNQQQYMAMMMNQQRMMNGDGMHQPMMMYGRPPPPPGFGYAPPLLPPPVYDPFTHMFSDENTAGGCSIM